MSGVLLEHRHVESDAAAAEQRVERPGERGPGVRLVLPRSTLKSGALVEQHWEYHCSNTLTTNRCYSALIDSYDPDIHTLGIQQEEGVEQLG